MNEIPSDAALERAYRPFRRDHARQRENLLQAIAKGDRLFIADRPRRQPKYARAVLSLAALLVVGITLGVLFWPPGAPRVLAVELAREQLLEVKSLHLKGWLFQTNERDGRLEIERFPVEFFAERPSRFWRDGYGFSFQEEHRLVNVTHSYRASDGEKSIFVSHDQRLAVIQPANEIEAQLQTEQMLQQEVFDRLFIGLPEEYRYTGREQYNGVACDVYEYKDSPWKDGFRQRCRIWLDARSGMPVRMKGWTLPKGRPEEPVFEYHTIRINCPRPDELFTFEAPEDYNVQVVEGEAGPIIVPDGPTASGGGDSFGSWIPFNINDRAVLYCWFLDPSTDAKGLQRVPEFSLGRPGNALPCRHIPLRSDPRWNWSLLLPAKENGRIDLDDQLFVVVQSARLHFSSSTVPLRLPEETLRQVIQQGQESTIEPVSKVEPFTLEDLDLLVESASSD